MGVVEDQLEVVGSQRLDSATLEHHGIKGMKWGQRRTEAQLARQRKRESGYSKDAKSVENVKRKAAAGRGLKSLSNAELRQLNERMNLEQQYKSYSQKEKSAGQQMAEKILTEVGTGLVKSVLNSQVKGLLDKKG